MLSSAGGARVLEHWDASTIVPTVLQQHHEWVARSHSCLVWHHRWCKVLIKGQLLLDRVKRSALEQPAFRHLISTLLVPLFPVQLWLRQLPVREDSARVHGESFCVHLGVLTLTLLRLDELRLLWHNVL